MKIDLNAFHTSLVGVVPQTPKKQEPELFYTKESVPEVDLRRLESYAKDVSDLVSYLKAALKKLGKEETVLSVQLEYAVEDAEALLKRLEKVEEEIE